MWAVVLAAFVCGAAVSAAGFSIGWKHQAQKGTSAESALVVATASVHSLRTQLAAERSDLAAARAHALTIGASRAALRTSLARLHTQLASAQHALAAASAQAAPLSGDLAIHDFQVAGFPIGDIESSHVKFKPLVLDLTGRDDGFHFAADIDQDLVPIDEHDRTVHELTAPKLGVLGLFVFFEQRAHILGHVADLRG